MEHKITALTHVSSHKLELHTLLVGKQWSVIFLDFSFVFTLFDQADPLLSDPNTSASHLATSVFYLATLTPLDYIYIPLSYVWVLFPRVRLTYFAASPHTHEQHFHSCRKCVAPYPDHLSVRFYFAH